MRSLEYRFATRGSTSLTTTAQRFIQRIHGRDYRVEVTQVAVERWRAHVINAHGGPPGAAPALPVTHEPEVHDACDAR